MDNSPPPEPQDVYAHLYGGIPLKEIESLESYFNNYTGIKDKIFKGPENVYYKYVKEIKKKEDIKVLIDKADEVINKYKIYEKKINIWWKNSLEQFVNLPEKKNLFELNKLFSKSITLQFPKPGILDFNKSRGAFASYWDILSSDLKSVSASGWNAELIPGDEILKSQFPDILEELKLNEIIRDEIEGMIKEVNDLEDDEYNEEDYEVFPKAVLKEYKEKLKRTNGEIRAANKEIKNLNKRIKLTGDDKKLIKKKKDIGKQIAILVLGAAVLPASG